MNPDGLPAPNADGASGGVGAAQSPAAEAIVVIPTYAERENLDELLEAIRRAAPRVHILIVDDASGDGAPGFIKDAAGFGESIFLLERVGRQGLAAAYQAGFRWALERRYRFILQMDADLSHDPIDLPRLLNAARNGSDLVLGSRYAGGIRVLNWPMSRLLLSWGASWYVKVLLGVPVADPTGGFRCWQRATLELVLTKPVASHGYAFQIETLVRAWGHQRAVEEVPIVFGQRQNGASKMSSAIAVEATARVAVLSVERLLRAARQKLLGKQSHPDQAPRAQGSQKAGIPSRRKTVER